MAAEATIAALQARVAHLEALLAAAPAAGIPPAGPAPTPAPEARPAPAAPPAAPPAPAAAAPEMDASVSDDNPYSRLMALAGMGVVPEYAAIRRKTVGIVGVGGVGSVVAEMLTRCGVGALALWDHDTVERANMNRLFFRPGQVGATKVAAAAATLAAINPDVAVTAHHDDITTPAAYARLAAAAPALDLLLCCVDNYAARLAVNRAALGAGVVWMESGVSEDGVSGHIQVMVPGRTACFECLPPLAVAAGVDESTIRRPGVCAASLPTVMGIVAGLLAHNALKWLLHFGTPAMYQALASQSNYMSSGVLRPSDTCACDACRAAVASAAASDAAAGRAPWTPPCWLPSGGAGGDAPPSHDDNEWGIAVNAEGVPAPTAVSAAPAHAAAPPPMDSLDELAAELEALTRGM